MRTRIHEYEQRGVQASLELQQAARRVAWENERLRSLMVAKGISRQEIDDYIEQCRSSTVQGREIQSPGSASLPDPPQSDSHATFDSAVNSPSTALVSLPHGEPVSKLNDSQDIEVALIEANVRLEDTSPSVNINLSVDYQHSSIQPGNEIDPHETLCEVAASIIAGMRWHGNEEEARVELGCDGPRKCTVKNTKVFQIMDMP